MSRTRFSLEKIIGMLREAEVALSQGMTVGEVCRQLAISEQSWLSTASTGSYAVFDF